MKIFLPQTNNTGFETFENRVSIGRHSDGLPIVLNLKTNNKIFILSDNDLLTVRIIQNKPPNTGVVFVSDRESWKDEARQVFHFYPSEMSMVLDKCKEVNNVASSHNLILVVEDISMNDMMFYGRTILKLSNCVIVTSKWAEIPEKFLKHHPETEWKIKTIYQDGSNFKLRHQSKWLHFS